MLGKVGDLVTIVGIGNGVIFRIRFDDLNRELYTIKMDDGDLYVARQEELKWR